MDVLSWDVVQMFRSMQDYELQIMPSSQYMQERPLRGVAAHDLSQRPLEEHQIWAGRRWRRQREVNSRRSIF
jgi:hypothetical protein